jgi:excisionase family DNA binding protein
MLLKVKDLAAWLNVPQSTVYLWAKQGKIPCRKIYGTIRFVQDEIQHWLDACAHKPSNPVSHISEHTPSTSVDDLIARAKREVYNFAHGETRPRSSLIGKEERDGALEAE